MSTNPTVDSIYGHLVHDNGWHPAEVEELLEAHEDEVNGDGTTNASFDQWTKWAQEMPESN